MLKRYTLVLAHCGAYRGGPHVILAGMGSCFRVVTASSSDALIAYQIEVHCLKRKISAPSEKAKLKKNALTWKKLVMLRSLGSRFLNIGGRY